MPQQTVYIRNADMIKWKALENKAAFISEHLNKMPNVNIITKVNVKGTTCTCPHEINERGERERSMTNLECPEHGDNNA